MDFESFRIFCAVAAELSVTQAAAHLGRVPSNVTTRIQQLEAEVGIELFVRAGKRLALSAAGTEFLDYAQRLLALQEEALQVVTGATEGGSLRIGSMETTAAVRLPLQLARFHAANLTTSIKLQTGPSRPLIEDVRQGRLDCAFVALPLAVNSEEFLDEMRLEAQPLWTEEMRLLLPASETEATFPLDVRVRTLVAFRPGCTYRSMAEDILAVGDSPAWTVHEMASAHSMLACVAAGSCVTLLPASVIETTPISMSLRSLPVGLVATQLVWRKDYKAPAFARLRQQLTEPGI